jgi:hypothetical protein
MSADREMCDGAVAVNSEAAPDMPRRDSVRHGEVNAVGRLRCADDGYTMTAGNQLGRGVMNVFADASEQWVVILGDDPDFQRHCPPDPPAVALWPS